MRGTKLIGIDIGTQGTKAAIFSEKGECLAEAFKKSNILQPQPGVAEENPEEQVNAVCHTIDQLLIQSGAAAADVACIGIDGQMAGIIGIGRDGRNVTPYDSWLDTRCAPYIKKMRKEAGEEILRKTGCAPSFNHGPKKLWWKHERPDAYENIASFIQPGGYAAMRLCGLKSEDAYIDATYLHFSGFADNKNSRWDRELCDRFGLDMRKLPRIVRANEIVGKVSAEMATRTGLLPGTPVAAGCGDTIASFLSCGAISAGICVNVAGTSSPFTFTVDDFRADASQVLCCAQSAVPGLWYPYAYINGGGMNLEWFRKEIVNLSGDSRAASVTFDDLNALAGEVEPRLDDPVFIPHLAGRVSPAEPELRGAWAGLTWKHGIGHLYRGMLEGVALEYGIYMETLRVLYTESKPREVRITGGGGKSGIWNGIKADVLGLPFIPLIRQGDAPMGSALLAGFAAGLFTEIQKAADEWISTENPVEPDPEKYGFYKQRLERYKSLINHLNVWAEEFADR